jgi:hypothetical protein
MLLRQRLRALLTAEIEAIRNVDVFFEREEPLSAEEVEQAQLLKQNLAVLEEAVDGLDSLDGGVVPEIFKRKKGLHGIDSAAARTRRTEIACYVEVLHKMLGKEGLMQEAAIGLVADELAVSEETVGSWLDQARQSDPVRLEDLVTDKVLLYKYGLKFRSMSSEQLIKYIRSQVRTAGNALKKAMAPKNAKMKETKKTKK